MRKSIYVIKNKRNNKVYVGQAKDPYKRFISHLSRAKTNEDHSAIHDVINTLGKENFYYEILEKNIENYNEREKFWIKTLQCKVPYGYNLTDGGEEPPTFYGENHPGSVISNYTVINIIEDLKENKMTQKEISIKYNTNVQLITAINIGKTHRVEGIQYPIRKSSPYHLTEKEVKEIQWLLQNTQVTIKNISQYYKVSSGTIKHINAGRNYQDKNLTYPLRIGRVKGEKMPVSTILANRSTITIDT